MSKILIALISTLISCNSFAQFSNKLQDLKDINRVNNNEPNNYQMYPFLHKWSEDKTKQLLSKIDKYVNENADIGAYKSYEKSTLKGKIVRNNTYYASVCLEKSLYKNTNNPINEDSPIIIKKLLKYDDILNLKNDKFSILDIKTLNNYCSTAIEADWNKYYCQKAIDSTVKSSPKLKLIAVPLVINIDKDETKLPQSLPVECTINSNNPDLLISYNANFSYQITKPFEIKTVFNSLGPLKTKVGEAIVTSTEVWGKDGKPVSWKTQIVQH